MRRGDQVLRLGGEDGVIGQRLRLQLRRQMRIEIDPCLRLGGRRSDRALLAARSRRRRLVGDLRFHLAAAQCLRAAAQSLRAAAQYARATARRRRGRPPVVELERLVVSDLRQLDVSRRVDDLGRLPGGLGLRGGGARRRRRCLLQAGPRRRHLSDPALVHRRELPLRLGVARIDLQDDLESPDGLDQLAFVSEEFRRVLVGLDSQLWLIQPAVCFAQLEPLGHVLGLHGEELLEDLGRLLPPRLLEVLGDLVLQLADVDLRLFRHPPPF